MYVTSRMVRVIGRIDAGTLVSGRDKDGWLCVVIHRTRKIEMWPAYLVVNA